MGFQTAMGPGAADTTATANRYGNGDSPVTIAAGAVRVSVTVLADGVTLQGAVVPAGVSVDFGGVGLGVDELALVLDVSGDALVVEERIA